MGLFAALLAALAAGPACEALCRLPGRPPLGRARLVNALALALALFLVLVWVTLRPGFSALGTWAGLLALALTSNAKLAALGEPLLAEDRAELRLVFSHPGLYLPFLNRAEALGLAAGALAVPLALVLDRPLDPAFLPHGLAGLVLRLGLTALAGLAAWRALLPRLGPRLHAALSHRPAEDMARLGFFGTFGLSLLASWDPAPRAALAARLAPWPPLRSLDRPPHILAVQNEAFFDLGRLHPDLAGLLPHWNRLRASAAACGPLDVPAFGANTVRTEFAFLSGQDPASLGLEQFQPYARLARRPLDALPRRLARAGYRALCLHPYAGTFYGRHKVLPALGFQEFLDQSRLGHLARLGPHVSDQALAAFALDLLDRAGRPLFLFLVTMENHSPWLPGRLPEAELACIPRRLGPRTLDFGERCFLRHAQSADAMLNDLAQGLLARGDGVLCFFGDHQPSLGGLRRALDFSDQRSDALLWRPGHGPLPEPPRAAQDLPLALLRLAGLVPGD